MKNKLETYMDLFVHGFIFDTKFCIGHPAMK